MTDRPQLIDLTLPLRTGMRGIAVEPCKTVERDGWNASTLHLYSHCGTHMDSQLHFAAGSETIDQIPLDRCMGPAWVVRLGRVEPQSVLEPEHLGAVTERFRPGESLLLRTGWSRHVDTPEVYRNQMPRIGEALAHWCVDHCVRLLGVEPPSVADVNNLEEVTRIHRILLAGRVNIVESLTNLDALSEERVWFGALPLKVAGGDGAPCRAFAWQGLPPAWMEGGLQP
jgi:kynurenine formamidase